MVQIQDMVLECSEKFLECSDAFFDNLVCKTEKFCHKVGAHPRFDCAICFQRALRDTNKCHRCKSRYHRDCWNRWQFQSGKTHCMFCFSETLIAPAQQEEQQVLKSLPKHRAFPSIVVVTKPHLSLSKATNARWMRAHNPKFMHFKHILSICACVVLFYFDLMYQRR